MVDSCPSEVARLLAAYDSQLRMDAETVGAKTVSRIGPVLVVTFSGGVGFITHRDLAGLSVSEIQELVPEALSYFTSDDAISRVEWKSRAHDHAHGLSEALVQNGFVPQDPESIMLGDANLLAAVDVAIPHGVTLRQIVDEPDVRAMCVMQDGVFGGPGNPELADSLLHRLSLADGMELWVAEAHGDFIAAGRLEPVPNTDFAGIWGGATRTEWRGKGIYRALTAARARSALRMGKTLVHSDSTKYSRPILERSGLVAVSSTTPYLWTNRTITIQ